MSVHYVDAAAVAAAVAVAVVAAVEVHRRLHEFGMPGDCGVVLDLD